MNHTIYVADESLWVRMTKYAKSEHVSASKVIQVAIREYLDRMVDSRHLTGE